MGLSFTADGTQTVSWKSNVRRGRGQISVTGGFGTGNVDLLVVDTNGTAVSLLETVISSADVVNFEARPGSTLNVVVAGSSSPTLNVDIIPLQGG